MSEEVIVAKRGKMRWLRLVGAMVIFCVVALAWGYSKIGICWLAYCGAHAEYTLLLNEGHMQLSVHNHPFLTPNTLRGGYAAIRSTFQENYGEMFSIGVFSEVQGRDYGLLILGKFVVAQSEVTGGLMPPPWQIYYVQFRLWVWTLLAAIVAGWQWRQFFRVSGKLGGFAVIPITNRTKDLCE